MQKNSNKTKKGKKIRKTVQDLENFDIFSSTINQNMIFKSKYHPGNALIVWQTLFFLQEHKFNTENIVMGCQNKLLLERGPLNRTHI